MCHKVPQLAGFGGGGTGKARERGKEKAVIPLAEDLAIAPPFFVINVWLLTDANGRRFLIDTGDRAVRSLLVWSLARSGIRNPGDLDAILLTHWHRDHAGNASFLRDKFRCPVICHAAAAPYLEGATAAVPLADRELSFPYKAVCMLQDLFPAHSPVDELFTEGHWKWGFDVIPTPGHTDGTVMLLHRPTGTLFSGDSILGCYWFRRNGSGLRLAMPEFSPDVSGCRTAVRDFIADATGIKRLCPGHGPFVDDHVAEKLSQLAAGEIKAPIWRDMARQLGRVPRGALHPQSVLGPAR